MLSYAISPEADVLNRAFANRDWDDCPWYIFDLDPELATFCDPECILTVASGYIAFCGHSADVLARLAHISVDQGRPSVNQTMEADVWDLLRSVREGED